MNFIRHSLKILLRKREHDKIKKEKYYFKKGTENSHEIIDNSTW